VAPVTDERQRGDVDATPLFFMPPDPEIYTRHAEGPVLLIR